ncbi:MAG: hypothetical protein H7Y00_08245 [Fimbriimonadaceae bacterium]|nr:hypothetical protein [Chitinophagales bacterium]
MKKILLIVFLLSTYIIRAQILTSNFNGLSATTGNLRPDGETFGISLQNEMIHIRDLDTSVVYDVLYEFKNTTASYGNFNVMQPVTLYFNEFRPGLRSPMLDKLAIVFNDIFKIQDGTIDTRDQIKGNFDQRLFVRRYVSTQNLKALGIVADIFKNNQRATYKKVLVEFKWLDEDPYNLEKNTEVLAMEIKFITDLQFNPNEQFNVLSFLKLPATICGIEQKQIYAPYQIGYDKNWIGTIKNIYIQHDIFNATPIIPSTFTYTNKYVGERNQVIVVKNITPADKQHIAFYTIRDNYQQCGKNKLLEERSIIPIPVKNVTASSWIKTDNKFTNRNYVVTNEVAVSDNIQLYQTGNPANLDLLNKDFRSKPYTSYLLNDYFTGDCNNNASEIDVKESGHPIYAFDISNYNEDDSAFAGRENLQMQTCWCEGAATAGKGEYIEFELTQPVKAIKIYNGNQANNKVFDEGSKVDIIRFSSMDGLFKDIISSIIDLKIQNLYNIKLPAGKYRIYVDDVDVGKIPTTCISSITFDFDLQDEWYQKSMQLLESAYKKPK